MTDASPQSASQGPTSPAKPASPSRRGALAAGAAVATAGAAWWWFDQSTTPAAPIASYVLLNGQTRQTADYAGRVMLVNFWATSCTTCVAEMPQLVALHDKLHPQGLSLLAVAMSYDPPAYVVNFAETRKLPFEVAIDNTGAVARVWGDVKLTPTTFVVNRRSEIVKRYVGQPDFGELERLLARLLGEAAPPRA